MDSIAHNEVMIELKIIMKKKKLALYNEKMKIKRANNPAKKK